MDAFTLKNAIDAFLIEDAGLGDITTEAIFDNDQAGEAQFVAKGSFIAAGMATAAVLVFKTVNPVVEVFDVAADGAAVNDGDVLLKARGPVRDLLKAERVALNLVQRLSGIATLTLQFTEKVRPLPVKIVDTRKTTPGLRLLEKYAVRVGGGYNHRFNLADGVLIKDNHIAACGSIQETVARVRKRVPHTLKIEVETVELAQVAACVECGVDIIMLDNMTLPMMREAVRLVAGRALVEASGGINLENVRAVAGTGVDIISVGAITHSAPACDISMRLVA